MPSEKTKRLPGAPLQDPAAKVKEVQDLCQELFTKRDANTASRIAFEAGQLEAFFAAIRADAEQVADSAHALAALHTLVPPPPPPPLAQPEVKEEGARSSLGSRVGEEESFRPSFLGLDTPDKQLAKAGGDAQVTAQQTPGPADPNQFDLGVFFSNVSRSVVNAQRELDVASMKYSREQVNSPVPPALYSIPNVHAEIKASLSSTDGNGILVKLISDESQSSFTESTISFDIVSSPPPPGALGKFTAAVPRFIAVEGKDWQSVMDALGSLPKQGVLAGDGWQQRTIVVRDLDPTLEKLKQSVLVAFVFGPVPKPDEGKATDYTGVPLSVYKFTAGTLTLAPDAEVRAQTVRALASAASWLSSVTVT